MSIIEKLKSIPFISKAGKKFLIKREFAGDAKDFCSHYMYSKDDINSIEYSILLVVHSLEKGMITPEPTLRPFGEKKVKELLQLLNKYKSLSNNYSVAFLMGASILKEWKKCFVKHNWTSNLFEEVNSFVEGIDIALPKVGVAENNLLDIKTATSFDLLKALSARHSLRVFSAEKIKDEDIKYAINVACAAPSACNRQMCKIYFIKDEQKKVLLDDIIIGVGGLDKEHINYFLCTFDIKAFSYSGERNQGYFNAGLMAMNFVNALHFKGVGSCFLQWSNKRDEDYKVKLKLGIPKNEKIAVVIAAGYYPEYFVSPVSCRKAIEEVYREV